MTTTVAEIKIEEPVETAEEYIMEYLQYRLQKRAMDNIEEVINVPNYWTDDFIPSMSWEWPNELNWYKPYHSEDDMILYLSHIYAYKSYMSVEDNIHFYIVKNFMKHFKDRLINWVISDIMCCPK